MSSRSGLRALLADPRWRIVRFLIVGVLNTGFSYLLYALFLAVGLHYALANLLALVLSVLFSFRTQGTLVFGNRDPGLFWRFAMTWLGIYAVNIATISAWTLLDLNAYAAGALALPVTVSLSYLTQKHFVFRPDDTPTVATALADRH